MRGSKGEGVQRSGGAKVRGAKVRGFGWAREQFERRLKGMRKETDEKGN